MSVEDLQGQLVGRSTEPEIIEIEKGAIERFASATDDLNPLYLDEEYARNSRFGSIIAPPGFFGLPPKQGGGFVKLFNELREAMAAEGFLRILDAGIDYQFFYPVRAGDTLVAFSKISDVIMREGKAGKMIVGSIDTSHINQFGALVGIVRKNFIFR
ncbi:MaoC family dehydratase N-terminal domain-containing protein [Chloroflexota bacterium]